jgi:hypothetical protein
MVTLSSASNRAKYSRGRVWMLVQDARITAQNSSAVSGGNKAEIPSIPSR